MVPLVVFMVSTPEDFLALTRSRIPDPETGEPDAEKMMAFLGEHPETANALQLGLPKLAPTTSFATSGYNGLHAFALVNEDGEKTWGRYHLVPEEGEQYLSEEQIEAADRDYLQQEIRERLDGGTARFSFDFTLASEGDSLEDPTAVWEGDHEVVTLGTLEVTGVLEDAESDGPLVFDPINVTEGSSSPTTRSLRLALPPTRSRSTGGLAEVQLEHGVLRSDPAVSARRSDPSPGRRTRRPPRPTCPGRP